MLSWQVGRVKITRIVEMDLPVPAKVVPQATPEALRRSPWLYPHFVSEDDATLKLSIHALLVEAPGLKLIVDTCIGNDRPREITGGEPLATPFLQHLGEAGWSREGVDAVVCTHLHVDHVGWNTMLEDGQWTPTFPKARYLIGRREYEFWSACDDEEQQAMLGDSVKPVFDAGLVQLVELDHVVSPEIRLTPSIGHTPGHVSVMIESEGERAAITGDMAHHPCQMAHPDWMFGDDDPKAAALTRARLFAEWADQPILVIGTHFAAPTAGHVVRDGAAFRFAVRERRDHSAGGRGIGPCTTQRASPNGGYIRCLRRLEKTLSVTVRDGTNARGRGGGRARSPAIAQSPNAAPAHGRFGFVFVFRVRRQACEALSRLFKRRSGRPSCQLDISDRIHTDLHR